VDIACVCTKGKTNDRYLKIVINKKTQLTIVCVKKLIINKSN